jgi:hypothetical protein
MQRLLFLSSTSLLLLASAPGCGDDDCGPGGAPSKGLTVANADVQFVYEGLMSGTNNDCPDPQAPEGVISLTISGTRVDGAGIVTLCVPRPDKLADGLPLGMSGVRVIDLNAEVNADCKYTLNAGRPPTGTASASGLCDAGANSAGFALTVDGALWLDLVCGNPPSVMNTIMAQFTGTVAVTVP